MTCTPFIHAFHIIKPTHLHKLGALEPKAYPTHNKEGVTAFFDVVPHQQWKAIHPSFFTLHGPLPQTLLEYFGFLYFIHVYL